MADIDDVANWCPKQVIDWFRGLDDGLQHYIPNLEEAKVTGAQLLSLNYEDLENLGVSAIGHQVLILDATELLKQLHYDLEGENLQSRALDLNCRCRALRSHISSRGHTNANGTEAFRPGPSVALLKLACDVLDSSKLLVMWLDRPPFYGNNELQKVRSDVVRLSHELSTTVQQPIFACTIEDAVLAICADMESLSNQMIASNDVMSIQPAFLEVTHLVNRDPSSGLGLFIKATFEGHHVITGTKEGSISSRIRRITPGDEVVAVGSRNVVGWQLAKLVAALKETQSDISITLKKRPQFTNSSNTLAPLSRRNQKYARILTAPPVVQPIQKVVEMRKNSMEGSIDSNLEKIGTSKESLNSPKKDSRKKKKLKKEKAKSSSNILASHSDEMKKLSRQHRGSLSQESSMDRNPKSTSSMEAVASSSTSNLTKNLHLRKSLEKVWKKEKLDSNKSGKSNKSKTKHSKSESHAKSKKGKMDPLTSSENIMPNNNDVLEELRLKRLKQSEAKLVDNKSPSSKINHQRYPSEPLQQPSSPLDFLVIPPPPKAPYTPRVENVLQNITDEESLPRSKKNSDKPSESPNSRLDSEHRRRFTIIGSEQMDEKWYNSLLSEVNEKRAQWKSSVSSRKILERLDETVTASEDSVFTSQSVIAEEITVVKRGPRPLARNRPMSMPPNYYSAAKLNQYRIGHGLGDTRHKGSSSKISDGSSPLANSISPVAHQVDANGIRKLAPLTCSIEDVNRSRSGDNSLDSRGSSRVNANNNNLSSSERKSYQTPPKPAPRNTPPSTIGKAPNSKENKVPPSSDMNDKKLMQRGKSEPHLLQSNALRKPASSSPTPDQVVQAYNPHSHNVQDATRTQSAITEELGYFFAKQRMTRPSTSSDVFSPGPGVSSHWGKNNDSLPRSPAMGTSMVRHQIPSPLTAPVAKPRNMIKSGAGSPKVALMPNPKQLLFQSQARQTRIQSVDTSELMKSSTPTEPQRRKSESVSTEKKLLDKNPLVGLAEASPSSRGSYVAAIDGGFSLDDLMTATLNKAKDGEVGPNSHVVKVIDGVKVKLRKSPALTRSNSNSGKKARLKIVDQLRASPEMRSQRRVSCRDLGAGECDGWLWKKKTNATSPLSSKWSKRWVVLKDNALYCYHTEEDDKAESYIYLPGYKITPAPESKKKFAFRVAHPQRKTFYFASERQMDMTRWMNKLGLAAIEYTYPKTDNHTTKDENYFSESDSEDASNTSQSEPESGTQTPNSSPEKPLRNTQNAVSTATATPPRKRTGRHMSTQPDLNRSARYPRNKAEILKSSATTQTTDSLQKEMRTRSKSETSRPGQSAKPESNGSNSPVASARKTPALPEDGDKTVDAFRKQPQQSSNGDTGRVKSSQLEEELKAIEDKKDQELVKQEPLLSASSAVSAQSVDSQNLTERSEMFGKHKKNKKKSILSPSKDTVEAPDKNSSDHPPKLKVQDENAMDDEETSQSKDGSMDDLRKAFQNADVDFRGVSRKATLKRRVTILSRDPKRNDLLLKKRALQRQIKAREGELEYIKLLDDQVITSELIHDWINQHQSFFSDLGTIRRLSKRRKNVDKLPQCEQAEENQIDNDSSETTSSSTHDTSTSQPVTTTTPPVPAMRTSLLLSDSSMQDVFHKSSDNDLNKSSDSELPPAYSSSKALPIQNKVRPRSWAISMSDSDKIKAKSTLSVSPNHDSQTSISETDKHYLETDL